MRKISVNKAIMVLLLAVFFAMPSRADQQQETAYIEWKPAEGALSYTVQIADEFDEVILEKTTTGVKLEVVLPYGKYKYRVGMLTKFSKVSGWSDWKTLMIVPALEPKILSATPPGLPAWIGNRVTVKGKNFYRSSEVMIKNAESELKVRDVRLIDPETLSVTVDAAGAKPGSSYDLVVRNPGDLLDLDAVAPKQFTILERPKGTSVEFYAGIETGYYTPSLGIEDAYSGCFGVKLYYEFHSLGRSHPALSFLDRAPGLYPGVLLSASGFLKPKPGFDTSSMLQFGLYLGYEFSFPLTKDVRWQVSPFLGYKQYFRWHTYIADKYIKLEHDYFGTRPIIFLGGAVTFDLPRKFFIGLTIEYNAVFENLPVNLVGVFIRCGYRL